MRYFVASLLVVSLLGAANMVKVEAPSATKMVVKGTPQSLTSIQSDQPDTLAYDDWNPSWGYSPCTGCMGAVRFTAPGPFEMRTIYFDLYNVGGATDTFYVTVFDTLDGTILAGPYGNTYDAGFWSVQLDIDTTQINPGDFWIVEGPQVGWGLNTMVFDDGTSEFRSYVNFDGSTWENETGGDLCLRAGGEISGDWIDAMSVCVFDDIQKFFMTEGSDVYLQATIRNNGSLPITDYTVYFSIVDTFGTTYFTASVPGVQSIPVGGEVTVITQASWTASPSGYYIAKDSVVATNDINPANDVTVMELRPYDETVGNWFEYTDGSAEACYSWQPGNMWAQGFLLDCYPVTLDTIGIGFGVSPDTIALDVPFEIWWGMDAPEIQLVTGLIDTVFDGYIHLIAFDPPIEVDSGMIFIAYPYYVDGAGNSVCLFQDQTIPRAGNNHCVDIITYQYYGDPPQWYEDNAGDWYMWAFFSECSAQQFTCGDVNCNGVIGFDDINYLAAYLYFQGTPPCSMWAADVNCSGSIGFDDLNFIASYLYFQGPAPQCCP